jgi:hypothetical protein
MGNFSIKSKTANSLSEGFGPPPFLEIEFLGCGGAFDINEANSSVLITAYDKKALIDCGPTVYPLLKNKDVIGDIDVVFITHTHEDHIGSLSTLIYDKWYIHQQKTIIECGENVSKLLKAYLTICGHISEQYEIRTEKDVYYDSMMMQVLKINTMGHHFETFPNYGFVFNFEYDGDFFFMVYSGDINKPIIKLLPEEIVQVLYGNSDDVIMFHDMTALDYPGNPHCNFKLLEGLVDYFDNMFTYHHSAQHLEALKEAQSNIKSLVVHPDKTFLVQKNINN